MSASEAKEMRAAGDAAVAVLKLLGRLSRRAQAAALVSVVELAFGAKASSSLELRRAADKACAR